MVLHIFKSFPTIVSVGQLLKTGNSASVTVTVKVQVTVFKAASTAVYVTVVVPMGKIVLLDKPGVIVSVAPGQLSVTVGSIHEIIAPQTPMSLFTLILEGQPLIMGKEASVTKTTK
jgi:hypothetical protein